MAESLNSLPRRCQAPPWRYTEEPCDGETTESSASSTGGRYQSCNCEQWDGQSTVTTNPAAPHFHSPLPLDTPPEVHTHPPNTTNDDKPEKPPALGVGTVRVLTRLVSDLGVSWTRGGYDQPGPRSRPG